MRFSLPLSWCRVVYPVLDASQVSHSAAICPYSCADSGRNPFCSRRRVNHPVGMSCINAQR